MKMKILLACGILVLILVLFLCLTWDVIFQKGNPVPYIYAMTQLSEETPFAAVDDSETIFITKHDNYLPLFEYLQESNDIEFLEQMGSGYVFTNGTDYFVVSSEVYWNKYKVWTLRS